MAANSLTMDTFKAAYDTDPRLKAMIQNFSEKVLNPKLKQSSSQIHRRVTTSGNNSVASMAKSATDIGDKL